MLPDDIRNEIIENSKAYHERELEMSLPANSLVAYQYGAEFGYQLSQAKAMKLVEALEWYIKNCEVIVYDYFGESPKGGYLPSPFSWNNLEKALATFKQQTTPREDEG